MKRKGLSFYDSQHLQKMLVQQNDITAIFNRFIAAISPYLQQWADKGKDSVWVRNQSIEKRIDRELVKLQSDLLANITQFQMDAWKRSELKNDDFISRYIEGLAISTAIKEGLFAHNAKAMLQLKKGMDIRGNALSDRVWNIAELAKEQLEYYLASGVSVGRNAGQIGRDVRQLLKEPDKRFRRVRDANGKLILSQPMKNYHPGQGVYRSASMNALRLSSTTTNMAYRAADYERWNGQDFVLGIEIRRSDSNRGPCALCDSMVGKYPKTFKFTGFHPFCICYATPIVMEPEDLAEYLVNDTIPEELVVKDIPQSAKAWVNKNLERAKGWSNEPYFIRDNRQFFGELKTNIYTLEEKKFTRTRSTSVSMQRATDFLSKEYPNISNTRLAAIHHYTKAGGNYRQLNKQLYNDNLSEFNKAAATLIREGLNLLPTFKGITYRGTIIKRKEYEALYKDKKEVSHKIFTSCSKSPEIADMFASYRPLKRNEVSIVFTIQGKNGKDISKISEFNGKFVEKNQYEILFATDTRFEIISVSEQEDKINIKLKEL